MALPISLKEGRLCLNLGTNSVPDCISADLSPSWCSGERLLQHKTKMKKLNLAGISSVPSSARDAHPTVTPDADTMRLLEQFVVIEPQFKTLKNQKETLGKQLAAPIRRLWFEQFAGVEPESSTLLVVAGGKTVKLTTKNAYTKQVNDEADLVAAIGQELTSKYFRQATVLKLDLDKMPEDKQESFATAVIDLANKMGVTAGVSASQCIQPVPGFHEARTSILTVEQNIKLDSVLSITAYAQL